MRAREACGISDGVSSGGIVQFSQDAEEVPAFTEYAEQENIVRRQKKTRFEKVIAATFKEKVDAERLEDFSKLVELRQRALDERRMPALLVPFADARVFVPEVPSPEFYKLSEARRGVALLLPQVDRSGHVKDKWDTYMLYKHVDCRNGGSDSRLLGSTDDDSERLARSVSHALGHGSETFCSATVSGLNIRAIGEPWILGNTERFHTLTHSPYKELLQQLSNDGSLDDYARRVAQNFTTAVAPRIDLPFDGFGPVTPKSPGGPSFRSMQDRHGRRSLVA